MNRPQTQGPRQVYGNEGSVHSYSLEERRSFAEYVNQLLKDDPDLRDVLPLNPNSDDLFKVCSQGLLLIKLINATRKGIINDNKIVKKKNPNPFERTANHNLAIAGARELGCNIVNISAEDLNQGKPHLLLGLVWQVVKIGLLSQVSLEHHPELVTILNPNEDLQLFMRVAPEVNLLRWFNYHLKRAQHPRAVNNFSRDVMDGENYLVLLNQIAPNVVPRDAHREPDARRRAELVCKYAEQLDCLKFVTPQDILDGNEKLNLAFTAYLFNKHPGLEVLDNDANQQRALAEAEKLMKETFEREEIERKKRWELEEQLRRQQWAEEEERRKKELAAWELERRRQLEEEERALRSKMAEEELKRKLAEEREAMEKERKRQLEEENRRLAEEERRRDEARREQERLAEEQRRRAWEAEQHRREMMLREEEARRREEAERRQEEERRRRWEEDQRRMEEEQRRRMEEDQRRRAEEQQRLLMEQEMQRRQMEELARQRALEAEAQRQRALEAEAQRQRALEEQRRIAMEQEMQRRQMEELARQRALEAEAQRQRALEEQQRQQAWQQYQNQQALEQQRQQAWIIEQQRLAAQQQLVVTQQLPQVSTMTTTTTTAVHQHRFPIQRLIVTVVEARRLVKKDLIGKADPYVVLLCGGSRFKTNYIKNTQDPFWNQDFEFRGVLATDSITLQIYDKDIIKKDDFLGEVRLMSSEFVNGNDRWYPLQSRDYKTDRVHGELHLRIQTYY